MVAPPVLPVMGPMPGSGGAAGHMACDGGHGYLGTRRSEPVPLMPMVNFPPQPVMNSFKDDGPLSVAFRMPPASLQGIRQKIPCPDTMTYPNRMESFMLERNITAPKHPTDICGWVQASVHAEGFETANEVEQNIMGVNHNEFRLVFQCISGWILMQWRSQEDFEEGIHGARRAPRCLAWFDLRQAFDVFVEVGDHMEELCPHRISVLMNSGILFFRVELPEDVPVWYNAVRRLIQDAAIHRMRSRDTELHQMRRWPVACMIASKLRAGIPLDDETLEAAFHSFDNDYDCVLRVGELCLMVEELKAGLINASGIAEGQDRGVAILSVRDGEDYIFDKAIQMRRICDGKGCGTVNKDDFLRFGHGALLQAMDMGVAYDQHTDEFPAAGMEKRQDVCSMM